MARLITVLLRLLIWCLLSADLGLTNVLIGLLVAIVLPMAGRRRPLPLDALLRSLAASLAAVPQAYGEALRLLAPGRPMQERRESQQVTAQGSALLVFLEVFRITLTPLTIALGVDRGGRAFRVHRLAAAEEP